MVFKNGKHKLSGFVDLGSSHDVMSHLAGKSSNPLNNLTINAVCLQN